MGELRVMYKLDGIQKYEKIDPKYVEFNNKQYVDEYRMLQNAELYAEGLRDCGARDVRIEWDVLYDKSGQSRSM